MADIFVDPSINAASGAGTVGSPYGDLQHALDTVTQGTNGDEFHIKAGTSEIINAELDFTAYTVPTYLQKCVFRGYTSAARDGGIGTIDGDGLYPIIADPALGDISMIDMHLTNTGTGRMFYLGAYGFMLRCEISITTSPQAVYLTTSGLAVNCHFHNCGSVGLYMGADGRAFGNYFKNDGANDFSYAMDMVSRGVAVGNIFSLDGASSGIDVGGDKCVIHNNSILGGTSTGSGINVTNVSYSRSASIANNIVEGFSGAGGQGIDWGGTTVRTFFTTAHNACYNNTTDYVGTLLSHYYDDNEVTADFAATLFDGGTDSFANRFVYFSPKNDGNLWAGSLDGYTDKGAVQHAPAGGGLSFINSRRNTMIGR